MWTAVLVILKGIFASYTKEIIGGLALVLLCLFGYFYIQGWCNNACRNEAQKAMELENSLVSLRREVETAKQRASDLALLWSKKVMETQKTYEYEYNQAMVSYKALESRADRLATDRVVLTVSADTYRLLYEASQLANANPGSTGGSQTGTTPVPATPEGSQGGVSFSERDYTLAWIEASKAYASCRIAWGACVKAYSVLQAGSGNAMDMGQTPSGYGK